VLPAPERPPRTLNARTVAEVVGILIIALAVVYEAARLDFHYGALSEKVGQIADKVESLLQGEAKREVQEQNMQTDLHEMRRDLEQRRIEAAERGAQKQPPQRK
jgi:hypothetical protein